MLDANSSVEVAELLDLTLALSVGWLVDWHLDLLVEVSDDDGLEGGELGVDHFVVDTPKSVEIEHLLVPAGDWLHFTSLLVTDAMVDELEVWDWDELVKWLDQVVLSVSWQEQTGKVNTLDERVDGVAVGLY